MAAGDRLERGAQPSPIGPAARRAHAARAIEEIRPGDAAPSPEAAVLGRERRDVLLEAVNGLSEEHRLVIACRYFLELSEAETATALGVRPGTVKSRVSRALERLREEVGARV